MTKQFDYIVIGSGPAAFGLTTALKEQQSTKTALIIDNDRFGGTCPNYGCEPKIFLEGAVRNVLIAQQLQGRGIQQAAKIDWSALMAAKQATFAPYPDNAQSAMTTDYVQTLQGTATFADAKAVMVNGQAYQADKIVIATGLKANHLPIQGQEYTHSSNDVLDLAELPERVTFIGSGYVGMELATVLSAAGAQVEVIEHSPHALGAFYPDHAAVVVKQMTQRGIRFHFGQSVNAVRQTATGFTVETAEGQHYDSDYVIDSSGRVPNIDRLALDVAGVATDRHGILVDDHLQTNVAGIYAAGDVISKDPAVAPQLTPVAQFEGEYLAAGTQAAITYPVMATGSFTFPQIAQVGMPVAAAVGNSDYRIKHLALSPDFAYAGTNDEDAELVGIFDQQNHLVGASEVSQTATDDINQLAGGIGSGQTVADWRQQQLYIFPTLASKIKYFLA